MSFEVLTNRIALDVEFVFNPYSNGRDPSNQKAL